MVLKLGPYIDELSKYRVLGGIPDALAPM